MKESEIKVTYEEVPENWFKNSFNSVEMLKKTITMLNEINAFDLYDMEEDLSEEKIIEKLGLKEHNIILPLTYAIEEFLKSVIILYDANSSNIRESKVKDALQKAKNQSTIKGNLHNASIFIDYIQNNIDPNFMEILGLLYFYRRKGYDGGRERHNPYTQSVSSVVERIKIAIEEFKNAFVDMRYLFEKTDEPRRMDLTKLMDYTESIRDSCLYLIMRKKYVSLLDGNNTFYDSKINSQVAQSLGIVEGSEIFFSYTNGCRLLNIFNYEFTEYTRFLFLYLNSVKQEGRLILFEHYIKPYIENWNLSERKVLEEKEIIESFFKKQLGNSIETIINMPTVVREMKEEEVIKKMDEMLEKMQHLDSEVMEWKKKLKNVYLPEYSKLDYKGNDIVEEKNESVNNKI